jgi:hypothetical protein
MNFIQDEIDKEMNVAGFKSLRKIVRRLPQTAKGQTNKIIDASRKALPSGKRISKTGKIYWETRANRTDAKGSSI